MNVEEDGPAPPGTTQPRRRRPLRRLHHELIVCGLEGHRLVGVDAREIGPEDHMFARESGGLRWHRCLRCDSWVALPVPDSPSRERPPPRDDIELPLRGKALRDRVVLRLIAVDRAFHFVVLAILAVGIALFAAHQTELRGTFTRVLTDLQGPSAATTSQHSHGLLHEFDRLLTLRSGTLHTAALVAAFYALLEGAEAVGLWYQKRWAEYLTFIATTLLLPVEVYELSLRFSMLKVGTLVINLAVVIYLIYAKRLFGVRGGAAADERERERDSGWEAVERATPADGLTA